MTAYPSTSWGGVPVGEYHGGSAPSGRSLSMTGTHQVPAEVDPDFVAVDATHCQFEKLEGEQCRAFPKKGEIYCGIHLRSMKALNFLNAAVSENDQAD